jgi:hypothetical protein
MQGAAGSSLPTTAHPTLRGLSFLLHSVRQTPMPAPADPPTRRDKGLVQVQPLPRTDVPVALLLNLREHLQRGREGAKAGGVCKHHRMLPAYLVKLVVASNCRSSGQQAQA